MYENQLKNDASLKNLDMSLIHLKRITKKGILNKKLV